MTKLTRAGTRWILPVAGLAVTQVAFDFAVSITLNAEAVLRIESPFRINGQLVDPEGETSQLAPALALVRATARSGWADDNGSLEMTFDGGRRIEVPPGDAYESWQYAGDRDLLVSRPGGDLGHWGRSGYSGAPDGATT